MIYFFMPDRVKFGEINIKYCPSYNMIECYLIKPMQISKFRIFKGKILNIQITYFGPFLKFAGIP